MTPEEIITEYLKGKRLEVLGLPGRPAREISSIRMVFRYKPSGSMSAPLQTEFREIRIKRDRFDFDEARKRLEAGKIIGKEDTNIIYKFGQTERTSLCLFRKEPNRKDWILLSGYPLDWPDSQDFYEVEE